MEAARNGRKRVRLLNKEEKFMELFHWDDKFDVGISTINRQHKELIDLINQLSEAMMSGKSHDVLGELLNELAVYGIKHFDTEEKYFKQTGYPGAKEHIKEHEAFKIKITELIEKHNEKRFTVSIDTLRYLKKWVVNHILEKDKAYSEYLISHKIQ